ncbi:hypothetical protein HDE_10371 [Halotydeus destructor]|nr:hypothetical protein HDE_10371 [Halotydeus destructor]
MQHAQGSLCYPDGRVRRQSTEGVSGMLSSVGGRLTSMRNSFRETVQPVREALNPMPHFETLGKYLSSASTNTVTRGREMVQNVREVGSRGVSRVRDGMTDAWDNVRDSWEDFWDL